MSTATEISIGRCELRIRRPRGSAPPWLSQADHRATADRVRVLVLSMLEDLLVARLETQGGDIADLSLDLRLTAADLTGAAPLARPSLRARLGEAVAAGLSRARPAHPEALSLREARAAEAAVRPGEAAEARRVPQRHVARLLSALLGDGGTPARLSGFGETELLALLREIASVLGGPVLRADMESETTLPGTWADGSRNPASARAEAVRLLLQAAAILRTGAAAPAGADGAALGALRADVRRYLDTMPPPARGVPDVPGDPSLVGARGDARAAAAPFAAGPERAGTTRDTRTSEAGIGMAPGRYALGHALPFLALARLARHGLTDAIALDLRDGAADLLWCVAAKAQPTGAPSGGGAVRRAVAAAVGLDTAPTGAEVARLLRSARAPLARATMAGLLIPSLGPGLSLPLVADGEALVLFDPAGLSPVVEGGLAEILSDLKGAGRMLCLSPSDGATIGRLGEAGLAVVAEGPPPRRSAAGPVAGPHGWGGHATAAAALPVALRARLPAEAGSANRAAEVWRMLMANAPTVADQGATPESRALDRMSALLAGFALADIGWALSLRDPEFWRAPDPLLVQERFADLSCDLVVTPDEVAVSLPMGRRFTDLRDAGLLSPVAGWPGWDRRRVRITGG